MIRYFEYIKLISFLNLSKYQNLQSCWVVQKMKKVVQKEHNIHIVYYYFETNIQKILIYF